jgi:hypothetical protein
MFVLFDFIDAQNKRRRFFSYSSFIANRACSSLAVHLLWRMQVEIGTFEQSK